MLLEKVRKTISAYNLIENGDKVLCCVSGGADSVCLLHVMLRLKEEYNLTVYVANVNHLIRGEESDEDSSFVKAICKAADVEFFYREYDIPRLSKELRMGEEECGRKMRYEFFDELSKKLGGAKIATAHNLNDNAETILFRLARGVSAEGMGGIKAKRDNIIRPLIDITRAQIEEYLRNYSIEWRNDSSNFSTEYARNNIRINVLPGLCEIFEGAERKIVSAASLISEDNDYINKVADSFLDKCFVDNSVKTSFFPNDLPIMRRVAGKILKAWNTKEVTLEKIDRFIEFMSMNSGAEFDVNAEFYAKKTYETVSLLKRNEEKGFYYIADKNCIIENEYFRIEIKKTSEHIKKQGNSIALFDADRIEKIIVRSRKPGDKILQKGLCGSKKISDIFSDEKIPAHLRDKIPIIEVDGQIIFLCGLRQAETFSANEETNNLLMIKYYAKGVVQGGN